MSAVGIRKSRPSGTPSHLARRIPIHDETRQGAPASILTARHNRPLTTEAIAVVFRNGTSGRCR